jgi:hypothetical protein
MIGNSLNRVANRRWNTFAVLVMLPLTVVNGRMVVGCGCTGHFVAVCHCSCGESEPSCSKHGTKGQDSCPCCNKHHEKAFSDTQRRPDKSDSCNGLYEHRCKPAVLHEVVPATVATTHAPADELSNVLPHNGNWFAPVPADRAGFQLLAHHALPPPDLIVQLHRLVI